MNVYLKENGEQIPGDLILKWVLRSDLTPVPRTLEMVVKLIDGLQAKLAVGNAIWTGRENLKYQIVKVDRADPTGVVQGKDQLQAMKVTALLASCVQIAYRIPRAVVQQNATLGALFRACGAQASIGNDFTVPRFTCLKGRVPSFQLAMALQEEGAALVLRNKQISATRLADLFKQQAMDAVGQADTSAMMESEFLERHEIPAYFSTDETGAFVMGALETDRNMQYRPRTDERTLRNLSKVLVTRKVMNSDLCEQINAGDLLNIDGTKLVVITAAHAMELQEGTVSSKSRLWLGAMSA